MKSEQFWTLLEPIHSRAEGFCRKLAGNRDNGDDLYQEALLVALRKFDSLREVKSFRSWLYRIIVNTYKNRQRRLWWRLRMEFPAEMSPRDLHDNPADKYALRRWLERALSVLSAQDRSMIILSDAEGWSVAELSRIFNKPEGTVKARLSRARKKMRNVLAARLSPKKRNFMHSEGIYAMPGSKRSIE
jgi:RNA polymerase sigma-70 factor (ECF subfamily)